MLQLFLTLRKPWECSYRKPILLRYYCKAQTSKESFNWCHSHCPSSHFFSFSSHEVEKWGSCMFKQAHAFTSRMDQQNDAEFIEFRCKMLSPNSLSLWKSSSSPFCLSALKPYFWILCHNKVLKDLKLLQPLVTVRRKLHNSSWRLDVFMSNSKEYCSKCWG